LTGNSPLRNVTPAEVAAFARDGYVVLREVLSPAWLLPLVEACNRLVNLPETLNITAEAVALALPTTADGLFGAPRYRESMPQRDASSCISIRHGRTRRSFNSRCKGLWARWRRG
jgi:hypothetical protein